LFVFFSSGFQGFDNGVAMGEDGVGE